MTGNWLLGGETIEIQADVDIEKTATSFHAHAVPDGIDIRPGDTVQVYGVPTEIDFGDAMTCRCRATVIRASAIGRLWTEFTAMFELTELYEVGFLPKET
ncbi:MAG: hypothetical protein H7Z10_04380 [Gemmatimonadaceae bacterium]|nr:hypothetical protein [Acetobacteraceae bacterium]